MSDVFYPNGLIGEMQTQLVDRVNLDGFEDGATSAYRYWPEHYFKRRFDVRHEAMTLEEYRELLGFFQRRGRWDSFWFRDNVTRTGNAKVRFAGPLQTPSKAERIRDLRINLEEVAPVRMLPAMEEMADVPCFWFDPNREVYYLENNVAVTEPALYDGAGGNRCRAPWRAGGLQLDGTLAQSQWFDRSEVTSYASSDANPAIPEGSMVSVFCIVRASAFSPANQRFLFSLGPTTGYEAGDCLGIYCGTDGSWGAWDGGNFLDGGLVTHTPDTWISLALCVDEDGYFTLYKNGVAGTPEMVGRTFKPGPITLFASPDGDDVYGEDITDARCAHVIGFATDIGEFGVKHLHNLLAHQYGMSQVT